jgi:Outer membrane protein beta-barrel domain
MNRVVALLLLATASLLGTQNARAQLGVAAGLNFESISDLERSGLTAAYESATGYHVGVFFDFGTGPLALRLGAFYRDLGEFEISVGSLTDVVDVSALDFPIDLRFAILPTPVIKPYLLGGPVFSMPRSSDDAYDASLETVSVAGNVGFGVEVSAGGMTLLPEIRYTIGLTPFVKDDFSVGGTQFFTERNDQRSNAVMLRVGLKF